MKRFYKNKLDLKVNPDPISRVKNLSKEIARKEDLLPKSVSYKDIDSAVKDWVSNDLKIVQDGKYLPTMVLFSNQRFSEYTQTWEYTDDDNNIILNFKTVTRDSNPSHGNIHGEGFNIPGERYYTMHKVKAIDESGREYYLGYKMKQPTPINLEYTVAIMSNKYETINTMNSLMNRKFNAIQCYIRPNGHYMSMKLTSINDESEYNVSDRQFFSQSYKITVSGYIIEEDDLKVEELPKTVTMCLSDDGVKTPSVEIYEDECNPEDNEYMKPISLYINFSECDKDNVLFKIDTDFNSSSVYYSNIKEHLTLVRINGEKYEGDLKFLKLRNGDEINLKITRKLKFKKASIKIDGYSPYEVFNRNEDNVETTVDFHNKSEKIDII